MRLSKMTEMAMMNIVAMKRSFILISASFVAIVITLLSFFCYRTAVLNRMNTLTDSNASDCYLELSYSVPEVDEFEQIATRFVRYDWPTGLTPDNVDLVIDGSVYHGQDKYNYRFDINSSSELGLSKADFKVPFDISAVLNDNDDIFPDKMVDEMRVKTNSLSPVKFGSVELSSGKILVSDFMLDQFGLSEDAQNQLVGKKISFKNRETGTVYCNNLELCGVIDSNLFYVDSLVVTKSPHILISETDMCNDMQEDMVKYLKNEQMYKNNNSDDYDSSCRGNLKRYCYMRSFSDYKSLLLQLDKDGYTAWPSYQTKVYYVIKQQQVIVDNVISIIVCVFSITLLSYLMTALYFYYKKNGRFKQMLRALGMNNINVFCVSFIELLTCSLFSVMAGTIISIVFCNVFNSFIAQDTYVELSLSTEFFLVIPFIILLAFVLFSVAAASINCLRLRKQALSSALYEE